MPYHMLFDAYEEERLGSHSYGSTKSGIAPVYADKYAKIGLQVCELFDEVHLKSIRLTNICTLKNVMLEHLYHKPLLDEVELYDICMQYRDMIKPYICHLSAYLNDAIKQVIRRSCLKVNLVRLRILIMVSIQWSQVLQPLAGFGAIGAGIPPYEIKGNHHGC